MIEDILNNSMFGDYDKSMNHFDSHKDYEAIREALENLKIEDVSG